MQSLLRFLNILHILFLSCNLCYHPTFFNQCISKINFTRVEVLSLTPTSFSNQAGRKLLMSISFSQRVKYFDLSKESLFSSKTLSSVTLLNMELQMLRIGFRLVLFLQNITDGFRKGLTLHQSYYHKAEHLSVLPKCKNELCREH